MRIVTLVPRFTVRVGEAPSCFVVAHTWQPCSVCTIASRTVTDAAAGAARSSAAANRTSTSFTLLERWTRGVLRRRVLVLACWLALATGGAWAWTQLPSLLTSSFRVPGTE